MRLSQDASNRRMTRCSGWRLGLRGRSHGPGERPIVMRARDRVDVDLRRVEHPRVGRQWEESIVRMPGVPDRHYDIAFANWVLEHVDDVGSMIREVARILRPGGVMVMTLPNPRAPEFRLAAHTPQWVHRALLPNSFETHYAYGSISRVREYLEGSGMRMERSLCAPVV